MRWYRALTSSTFGLKEVIVSGGENIYSAEVERAFMSHRWWSRPPWSAPPMKSGENA
jgi:acyl-CoA synthetase (AMP-forming)/AMP-acid ligase II